MIFLISLNQYAKTIDLEMLILPLIFQENCWYYMLYVMLRVVIDITWVFFVELNTFDCLRCGSERMIYTVSQKTVHFCFCHDFVKFPKKIHKFWQVDGKMAEIACRINIFHLTCPTSPPYLVKLRCSKLLHNAKMHYYYYYY